MSDVFSLFEEEAADPQAFNKVSEGETSKLSTLIRQSLDLDNEVMDAEKLLKDLQQLDARLLCAYICFWLVEDRFCKVATVALADRSARPSCGAWPMSELVFTAASAAVAAFVIYRAVFGLQYY